MKGMDQNMKKFLTIALIAAMMLSMIVVGTSADAWDGTTVSTALTGEGTAEKPYLIATAADLAFLAKTVNEGEAYVGKYFTQTADIDLGNKEWTPIGTTAKPFKGVYDGCNKNITGLYITNNANNALGLFGAVFPDFVEVGIANVNLKGAIVIDNPSVDAGMGGLVGWGYKDSNNLAENSLNIINCVVDVDITMTNCTKQPRLGGVMGYMFTGRIENVEYKGTINYTGATGNSRVGGIIGQGNRFAATNCVNNGEINVEHTKAGANVGGIIGMQTSKGDPATQYNNCVNNGKITVSLGDDSAKKALVAGIVGGIYSPDSMYNAEINNCLNTGDISATTLATDGLLYVSGILAYANKDFMYVNDSVNSGLILATGGAGAYAGGIVGITDGIAETTRFHVKNCIAAGNLAGEITCTVENNKENVAAAEVEAAAKVITDAVTKSAIRINGFATSDVVVETTPVTTEKVEETKAPDKETTAKPVETTKAPDVETTKAPVTNEAPKKEGGCGSIVGGGLAVVALVGIAVIVSKKKD